MGDTLIKTCQITSDEASVTEIKFRETVATIEQSAYTPDMDDRQKLCAIKKYIYDNFSYDDVKCTAGAKMLLIAARNLGLECHYRHAGPEYDLYGKKGLAIDTWSHQCCGAIGGHVAVIINFPDSDAPTLIDANGH